VSVLTPTYQQAEFLPACLASVSAQTSTDWEQIIVDDGSSDTTSAIAAEVAGPRVHYVRQAHVGIWHLLDTYNKALRLARGDLIAILEGDDVWLPRLLEALTPAFTDRDVVLSYGVAGVIRDWQPTDYRIPDARMRRRFGGSALVNEPIGSATYAMLHRAGLTFTFPCATIVRRSALESIGGFQQLPGVGTVDYPTFLMLSTIGRFAHTPELVSYWRRHAGSTSARLDATTYESIGRFAVEFAERRGMSVGLDSRQINAVRESWRDSPARLALQKGRTALVARNWREARRNFTLAVRTRSFRVLAAAVAGYSASWLHIDIERVLRAVGRMEIPAAK
jgi:hypothetical protein